jgi:hypothetical protein
MAAALDHFSAAKELARRQFEIDPGLSHVYQIREPGVTRPGVGEPIKLLQVNTDTAPSGILPLHFGAMPAAGIPYASVVIEVTPAEFEKIKRHELQLPHGWEIGDELPRPSPTVGAA